MKRWIGCSFVVALSALAFAQSQSRADSSTAQSTVTVKVVDENGKAVSGAKVALIAMQDRAKHGANSDAEKQHPTPVAQGETDDSGSATLSNVPNGVYAAVSRVKGNGNGHARVSVSGAGTVTVTIKLKHAAIPAEKGPTSQPAHPET